MILNLHLTHACNLRCDYCYADPKGDRGMDPQTALDALRFGARHARDELRVVFFGGEPLLRKELLREVVEQGERIGREGGPSVRFQLSTNGLLCDDEFLAFAARCGMRLSLSIDGCREAHDLHRVRPDGSGTWEEIAARVPRILASQPWLHVQMVISPDTAHLIDRSFGALLDLGLRNISSALDHGAAWDREALERLAAAYRRSAALYEVRTLRGMRFHLGCFDTVIRTRVIGPVPPHQRCQAGWNQVSVAPSGRLYPCVQFVRDDAPDSPLAIGHVASGWNDEARARLRAGRPGPDPCDGCALRDRCMHHCACVNLAAGGDANRVPPIVCEHERLRIPIADALASRLYRRRSPSFLRKHYDPAWPVFSALEELIQEVPR